MSWCFGKPCLSTQKQELVLNYESLTELPDELFEIEKRVEKLYLKGNQLCGVPSDISRLSKLTELHIASNLLTSIHEAIGELKHLTILDMSSNRLTSLPDALFRATSLRRLVLSKNEIREIPDGLDQLTNLEVLNLAGNLLTHLDLVVCRLRLLRGLHLDLNLLVTLPRQVCQLHELEELSVCGNRLVSLPQDVPFMKQYAQVRVDNNAYLHAIPAVPSHPWSDEEDGPNWLKYPSIYSSQCATIPVDPSISISLTLQTTSNVTITLPREIEVIRSGRTVKSLKETALGAVHRHRRNDLQEADLPAYLFRLVQCPTATCHHCRGPIFIETHPVVLRIFNSGIHHLILCCSFECQIEERNDYAVYPGLNQ